MKDPRKDKIEKLLAKLQRILNQSNQTSLDVMDICDIRDELRKLGYDFKNYKVREAA